MKRGAAKAKIETGFVCECTSRHEFPMYVFAHWNDVITHTCEDCGRKHEIVNGNAALIGDKSK